MTLAIICGAILISVFLILLHDLHLRMEQSVIEIAQTMIDSTIKTRKFILSKDHRVYIGEKYRVSPREGTKGRNRIF